jgi:predicted Zn-dependent protease
MKTESPASRKPTKVVSPALLLSCFGICLGSAYFLIPKGDELYRLLLADGDQERVIELVVEQGEAPESAIATDVAAVAEPVNYQRLMTIAFDTVGREGLSGEEVARITSVLERCDPTSGSFANLKRHAGEIADSENEHFYNVLARRALGEGDPKLAADIYTDLAGRVGSLKVETVEMMVLAYRYTGQSKPAFDCIERMQKQLGDIDQLPAGMRDTYVALLMEVDRPGDAFDILRGDFEAAAGDAGRLEALLPVLVEAASYSERGAELPPYYEAYFAALPQSKLPLAGLAQIGRSELTQSHVAFLEHAKRYAQICEWNDFYDRSLDYYLKGAAMGDDFSLKRAIALNEGLRRDTDMADQLLELVPIPGQPQHALMLARLLGEDARYDQARTVYLAYIESNPDSAAATLELAALEEESGDLEAAINYYKRTSEMLPDDTQLKLRIAGLHVAFGEHEEAFGLYRSLPEGDHTNATLERLQMLAEALGDYEELNRAIKMGFARRQKPGAEHFLDLAQSHSLTGDTSNEVLVLSGAMHSLPESQQIAVALADVLYRESRFEEAMQILTRRDLRDNMQAMSLFIEICGGTDNHAYAAKYLAAGIEGEFDFAPSVRIELGQIYEETGKLQSAQQLYASVPEGGMAWQLLAAAKYKTGEYDRAEEYQRRYLKAAEQPDAQDWVFLGDICKNLGKEREANVCYKHSLNLLKSALKPHNASL